MWCFKNCFELFWRLFWRLCWNFSHAWSRGMPLRHPAGGLRAMRASDSWPLVATREHENNWKTRHRALKNIKNIFASTREENVKKEMLIQLIQLIREQLMDVLLCSARDSLFIPVADNIHSHTSPVSSPYSHNVEQRVQPNVRRISGHLWISQALATLRFQDVSHGADSPIPQPSHHGRTVTALGASCSTPPPLHGHGIAVFSTMPTYASHTLENVFAKHQKITKICPLTPLTCLGTGH